MGRGHGATRELRYDELLSILTIHEQFMSTIQFVIFSPLQGIQGNIGSWGEVGPRGPPGEQGPPGPVGPNGVTGYPVGFMFYKRHMQSLGINLGHQCDTKWNMRFMYSQLNESRVLNIKPESVNLLSRLSDHWVSCKPLMSPRSCLRCLHLKGKDGPPGPAGPSAAKGNKVKPSSP